MEKTALRILKAINQKEKIGIFGDYDVDGASSTALLANYLKILKQSYEIYIPDRQSEGYGPSVNSFQKLIDKKISLIITVDCGTMSFDAIDYANSNNIDVIVLDHHQSETNLPKAYSVINPNRLDDEFKFKLFMCSRCLFYDFNCN